MTTETFDVRANGDISVSPREAELEAQLRRERIIKDNLAQRVGALIAENLALLLQLQEVEQQRQQEGAP